MASIWQTVSSAQALHSLKEGSVLYARPLLAGAALLAPFLVAAEASAGISLVSQERGIGARANTGFDGVAPFTKTAVGFTPFNETATAFVQTPTDSDTGSASISQSSTVSTSGISTAGRYEFANRGQFGDGISTTRVVFDVVDTAEKYQFTYSLAGDRPADTSSNLYGVSIATIDLRRLDPPADSVVGPASIALLPALPGNPSLPTNASFNGSGVLAPGRYELLVQVGGNDFQQNQPLDSEQGSVDYSASLSFGGPVAVPLPPAAWGGIMMLGGMADVQYRRYRSLKQA